MGKKLSFFDLTCRVLRVPFRLVGVTPLPPLEEREWVRFS